MIQPQTNDVLVALEYIKKNDYLGAMSILSGMSQEGNDQDLAKNLTRLLTVFFQQIRQTKQNGLHILKNNGFMPRTVIDVGAQVGTEELYSNFPEAKHVMIEPVVECIPELRRVAQKLNLSWILNCAVSNLDGEATLSLSETKQYSSIDAVIGSETRRIEQRTVDSIVQEGLLKPPFLIKIDVDGPEVKVLEGCREVMRSQCVFVVEATVAHEGPRLSRIVRFMDDFDYSVYDIVDNLHRQSDWHLWQVDLIFLHNSDPLWGSREFQA
jgi:FkbM family methyltransferase